MHSSDFIRVIAASPKVFAIGVAGDSGSGKSTFTRAIHEIFGPEIVSTISMDDYHTLDREARKKRGITPLHPDANDFGLAERHLAALKRGETIEKRVYNHSTGKIEGPLPFSPSKIIIMEGLHPLITPGLRDLFDFTIFVDPAEEVKRTWKMKRDMEVRGYVRDEVEAEREQRRRDYLQYVAPQAEFADAIIKITPSLSSCEESAEDGIYNVTLLQEKYDRSVQNITLSFDLFSLTSLAEREFSFGFCVERSGERRMGALTIDGELEITVIRRLERAVEEQTGVSPISLCRGRKYANASEVIRLLLAWRIINTRIFLESEEEERA